MATPPLSSSGATLGPEAPSKAAKVADNPSYSDGILKWDGENLEDDDIITVIRTDSPEVHAVVRYTIYSLEPANASGSSPPTPFRLKTTTASKLPELFLERHIFKGLPEHLKYDATELHVLISTLSGTGLAPQFFDEVLEPLLDAIGLKSSDYNVTRTQSAESVGEFARSQLLVRANDGKKQSVLMLSGDGGMVDTINGLLDGGERSRYILSLIRPSWAFNIARLLIHQLLQFLHQTYPLATAPRHWQRPLPFPPQTLSPPFALYPRTPNSPPRHNPAPPNLPRNFLPWCARPHQRSPNGYPPSPQHTIRRGRRILRAPRHACSRL